MTSAVATARPSLGPLAAAGVALGVIYTLSPLTKMPSGNSCAVASTVGVRPPSGIFFTVPLLTKVAVVNWLRVLPDRLIVPLLIQLASAEASKLPNPIMLVVPLSVATAPLISRT